MSRSDLLMPNDLLHISGKVRPQSIYIAGNPGFGKSSLIQSMALHDIRQNRGVCVIDPTGDLVDRLLNWIPESRVEDTVYFDSDNPIPIDFFSYRNHEEREMLTSYLVEMFNLENAPVAKPRLQKIIGTLFDANENPEIPPVLRATFLDILRFIEDPGRRNLLLSFCPEREAQWSDAKVFKDLSSITERMIPFFESRSLKTMLGAPQPKLRIADVMEQGKILLVNLRESRTALFIGSLISSKCQQAAFARRDIHESKRTPFYLYIDECNTLLEFAQRDFEAILLRARKYKLCLTLANQVPRKLPPGIRQSLGTIQTIILFNLEPEDARIFKERIVPFEVQHVMELPEFKAICRTEREVFQVITPQPLRFSPASCAEIIRKRTVEKYSCDTAPKSFNKGNASSTRTPVSKPEEIDPSGTPNVPDFPSHGDKA
jgi:hypothetical protein